MHRNAHLPHVYTYTTHAILFLSHRQKCLGSTVSNANHVRREGTQAGRGDHSLCGPAACRSLCYNSYTAIVPSTELQQTSTGYLESRPIFRHRSSPSSSHLRVASAQSICLPTATALRCSLLTPSSYNTSWMALSGVPTPLCALHAAGMGVTFFHIIVTGNKMLVCPGLTWLTGSPVSQSKRCVVKAPLA